MLTMVQGDITQVKEGVIAHGVNCQGVMGAGAALAIRKKWPEVYDCYLRNQTDKGLEKQLLGSAHIIRVEEKLWVANCYTQLNYGNDGKRYASPLAIESSLEFAFGWAATHKTTLHAVKIGSDLGGLDWETHVRPIFEALNSDYEVETVIHYL